MCLAIPGKIIAVKGDKVTVDYGTECREASVIEGKYKIGDHVIVQGKIVVEKVPKTQIKKWQQFLEENDR